MARDKSGKISQRVGGAYPEVFEGTELIKSKTEKVKREPRLRIGRYIAAVALALGMFLVGLSISWCP